MSKTHTELQGMDVEDAREYIELFAEEFGPQHLYFAQHAAFPLALTPDLLYRLWINFQRNSSDEKRSIPWIAVADLLLSPLCKEVGHELYEMDITVRAELLNMLKKDVTLGMPRIHELSNFLLDYVHQQLSNDSNTRTSKLANAQRWTALAYTQPGKVARELSEALDALSQNKTEQVRVGSLIEALNVLAEPEGFEPLLVRARSVEAMIQSDTYDEKDWMSGESVVGGVESVGERVNRVVERGAEEATSMLGYKQVDIKEMATRLEIRKIHNLSTVLLLGARAGRLFRSEHFYDTLQKFSNRDFSKLSQVEQFGECYSLLTQNRFSETDIHGILSTSLKKLTVTKAETCLAELVKHGYFDEIISTNIDDMLEDALSLAQWKEGREFEVFRPRLGTLLSERSCPCRITKAFGDLVSRVYAVNERPSYLDSNQELKEVLQRLLARDILVVGFDPVWDEGILRTIPVKTQGAMWFVNEEEHLTEHPLLSSILRERNDLSVVGKEGEFDLFFTRLAALLLSKTSPSFAQSQTPLPRTKQLSTQSHAFTNSTAMPLQEAPRADVLLVTVTEVETRAVFDVIKQKHGIAWNRHSVENKTYYNLGVINEARVFLVQSERLGGSLQTVSAGIQALKPSAVVMVGIAFGFNPDKQFIGDILVSEQLRSYELQRYGSDPGGASVPLLRGERVLASLRLLDRFRSGYRDWPGPARVEFGLILSGEKLVDNRDFRDQLRTFEPEAIGGEMERAGLYAAAHLDKIDWIVVKAICDWADGNKSRNKSQHQKEAARNAALFTMHVLQNTRLVDSSS